MSYSQGFKAEMVKKLTLPGAVSATTLSREVGVPQPTLSKWVRAASRVGSMSRTKVTDGAKRPQDWKAQEKLEVVLAASSLSEEELGGFLRQRGLHRVVLERWREQMLSALENPRSSSSKSAPQKRRIQELEKELRRKDKALAEAAALLVLQKKVRELWGDEDESTASRNVL